MKIDKDNHSYYKTLNHDFLKEILKYLHTLKKIKISNPLDKEVTDGLIGVFINSLIQVEYKMYIEGRNLNGLKTCI
jgi:hypothetical protein